MENSGVFIGLQGGSNQNTDWWVLEETEQEPEPETAKKDFVLFLLQHKQNR